MTVTSCAMFAAAAVLALTGCTAPNNSGRKHHVLSVYNGISGQFVENFNPLLPTVLGSIRGMVFEPLFAFDRLAPLGTKPAPLLGKDYKFNVDGTVISVTTKKNVKWSDGTAFSARDVAYTFNLIRARPELETSGNTPAPKASDDTHLTLIFDRPSFTDAPTALGLTYIVPEHLWSKKANPVTDTNKNPVGTAPMALSSFTSQSYLLKRSKTYRDADSVQVDGVRVYSLSGNEAAANKLLAGELDWTSIFVPNIDKVLSASPDLAYSPTGSQQVVLSTCSNADLGCTGPQTSVAVRWAISAAINREQVSKLAYFGKAREISPTFALLDRDEQFIAKSERGALPMIADIAKAKRLLEGDGWKMGADGFYAKGGQSLSMSVVVISGYTDYITSLDIIAEQLKKAGIRLVPHQVANNDATSVQGLGNFQLAVTGIFQGPVGDPYYVYDKYFNSKNTGRVGTSVGSNIVRFSNPIVDAALRDASATDDVDAKAAAYAKIQQIITEDLPHIPIVNNISFTEFATSHFSGFPSENSPLATVGPGNAPDNGVVLTYLKAK